MSYEKPEAVPENQNDVYQILHTTDVVRELERELNLVGLTLDSVNYYKNEYCGDRPDNCSCPHWLKIKVINLHKRIYEPYIQFWVCKRKRVYSIRFTNSDNVSFVENNFWIDAKNRTQTAGKLIHSYGLKQAASDIKIAHQAAEIKHYKSKNYDDYYSKIFRKCEEE